MKIFIILFSLFILSGCCCCYFGPIPGLKSQDTIQTACRNAVKEKLKLPENSQFVPAPAQMNKVDNKEMYKIDSRVDSRTDSGQINRYYYECTVNYDEKNKKVNVSNLKIFSTQSNK